MCLLWYCTRKSQVTVSDQDSRMQIKPGHKVVPEYYRPCQSASADKQTNTQTKPAGGDLSSSKACIGFRTAWCYLCNVPHLLPQGLYHWVISGYVSAYVLIDWSLRALDVYSVCMCVCLRGTAYPVSHAAGAVFGLFVVVTSTWTFGLARRMVHNRILLIHKLISLYIKQNFTYMKELFIIYKKNYAFSESIFININIYQHTLGKH